MSGKETYIVISGLVGTLALIIASAFVLGYIEIEGDEGFIPSEAVWFFILIVFFYIPIMFLASFPLASLIESSISRNFKDFVLIISAINVIICSIYSFNLIIQGCAFLLFTGIFLAASASHGYAFYAFKDSEILKERQTYDPSTPKKKFYGD